VFDGTGWTTYSSADGLLDTNIRAITLDRTGHLWFGTMGGVSAYLPQFRVYLPLVVRAQ
jgi:ligand-binding sensor domain-containing protein